MMLRKLASAVLVATGICAQVEAAPLTGNWNTFVGDFSAGTWVYNFAGPDGVSPGDSFSAEGLDGCCYQISGGTLVDVAVTGENAFQLMFDGASLALVNDPAVPWHNPADGGSYVVNDASLVMDLTLLYQEDVLTGVRMDVRGSGGIDGFSGTEASFHGDYEGAPAVLDNPAGLTALLSEAQIAIRQTTQARFDIKPQSCENPVNVRSRGGLPAAIAGSESLDVTTVDVASVRLAGVAPMRSAVADAISADPTAPCDVLLTDGYPDLVVHFDVQELMAAIGGYDLPTGTVVPLELVANIDNVNMVQGSDSIRIINRAPGNQGQGSVNGHPGDPGSQGHQPTAPGNSGNGDGWGSANNPSDLLGLGKANKPATPGNQ